MFARFLSCFAIANFLRTLAMLIFFAYHKIAFFAALVLSYAFQPCTNWQHYFQLDWARYRICFELYKINCLKS